MSDIRQQLPAATCVAVEYPGYVRDQGKAVATLGGMAAVNASVSSNWALRLSFRPSDPTSHPLYGEKSPCCRLLLRISRPRPLQPKEAGTSATLQPVHAASPSPMDTDAATDPAASASLPASDDTVSATIVARIATVFTFPGLADFQFLPFDPALESRGHDSLPFEHQPDKAEPTRTRQPYIMVPPSFSIKDTPFDYDYQPGHEQSVAFANTQPVHRAVPIRQIHVAAPAPASLPVRTVDKVASAGAASAGPRAPPSPIQSILWTCTTVPQPPAVSPAAPGDSGASAGPGADGTGADLDSPLAKHVDQILAGRPIWSPALLLETVNARLASAAAAASRAQQAASSAPAAGPAKRCSVAELESVLRTRCYQFTSGPWYKTYIQLGHDPRSDPTSRRLQTISYTLPSDWFSHIHPLSSRLSSPSKASRQQSEVASAIEAAAKDVSGGGSSPSHTPRGNGPAVPSSMTDIHGFRALPTTRTSWLQLVDLQDDKIQHLLSRTDATKRCTEPTGWLTLNIMEQLKRMAAQRFEALMAQQPSDNTRQEPPRHAGSAAPASQQASPMDASSYRDTLQRLAQTDLSDGLPGAAAAATAAAAAASAAAGSDATGEELGSQDGAAGGVADEGAAEEEEAGGDGDGTVEGGAAAEDGEGEAEEGEEELEWDGGDDEEYDDGGGDDGEFFM
ncbi:MAG: hypothetical protein WDW36_003766 [Sanguina aurantia]